MIEQLMNRGVVTPEFVAAVMAIDLETPVFSSKRQELLQFIPEKFSFQLENSGKDPLKRHPDDLTQKVIAAIEKVNPPSNSTVGEFLTILKSNNPRQILEKRIQVYRNTIDQKLNKSDQATRKAELQRLYEVAIARRQPVFNNDLVFANLNETRSALLPVSNTKVASATKSP